MKTCGTCKHWAAEKNGFAALLGGTWNRGWCQASWSAKTETLMPIAWRIMSYPTYKDREHDCQCWEQK